MAIRSELEIGGLVTVGPKYVMAEHPPYAGNGTFEADEVTGRTFRVVGFRGICAVLALPDVVDADIRDEWTDLPCRRLTPATQPPPR